MSQLIRFALPALLLLSPIASLAAGPAPAELSDAEVIQFFASSEGQTVKCGTPMAVELQARGLELQTLAAAEGDTVYYFTPEGHFRITYATAGLAAVDPTDDDLSGVPDYVELVGSAFERSWSVEIDSLGFEPIELGGEQYRVSLLSRSTGYYGVTWPRPSEPGGSTIDLRYSMEPFCDAESAPDLCEVNLLLATIAHEFKHAIQIQEGWNLFQLGGDWIELDATWIEDLVFDDSNDYYRYLELHTTPFTVPDRSLATNNDYRYCTWQHYLGETYGQDFMLDLSDEIAANALNLPYYAQHAYRQVADDRVLDWVALWRDYTGATYLSGERAVAGMGFSEAAYYPTAVTVAIAGLPQVEVWVNLSDMAMRFHHFDATSSDADGKVDILFEGSAGRAWTVLAVFQRQDQTDVVPISLVDGAATFRTAQQVQDYDSFAVLVGNSNVPLTVAGAGSYRLTLGLTPVAAAPASVGRFKGRFRSSSDN